MFACPPAFKRALARLQVICLDDTWLTRQETYRFRCQAGHEFVWKADNLTGLSACPQCRKDSRTRRMQEKAAQDGSECLDSWRGSKDELYRYRCLKDPTHEWLRSFPLAMRTSGCPHCTSKRVAKSKLATDGLQRLQDYARSRGGVLLSPVYLGGEFKHTFGCSQGHTWEARPSSVLGQRQWCQQCRSDEQRHSLEQVRATAEARGGRFLSSTYLNGRTIYAWECHEGHTWKTSYASIRAGTWRATYGRIRLGTWCPTCHHMSRTKPGTAAWRRYQTHQPRE